ncbi:Por secretion system C-terminal sorting domain-containing protein [Algibacter lectus]|uniref:T9SS type A sorting domain-containing protein n=1 Tax=Algibacter lectus TaxID=221126 RepID=UPI0008EB21BA|nr:T9SS type A sorting domain-containing protein [Algibacter lectus]SFB96202.1 Por secretion system C-terminal sorting domain-containing protein [Algibacter lectus]
MKKVSVVIILLFIGDFGYAQDFKIINNNLDKRRDITHSINANGFIIGINSFGGGYITGITIPGLGNIMGVQAQKYGRGGQSSIRDLGRGGQYNPTQAGFSDNSGTECIITTVSSSKLVIPSRGCALYNGDGHFDFTQWENITPDHPNIVDGGNTDQDGLNESSLSVTIDGQVFTNQSAEVHSDFDFYGEYEDYTTIAGVSAPAIRHYFEYRFVRSSTEPKAAMKQFNEVALKVVGEWNDDKFLADISVVNPVGIYPGDIDNLNSISLSWSIRSDVAIWDPGYRYKQTQAGVWEVEERTRVNREYIEDYKLNFIIADSNDENTGKALGFYLPNSEINTNNIVGINESDNTIAYTDNRTSSSFFNDQPRRTPTMAWIGFRSELNGLINRSKLTGAYDGIYEKVRQEVIMVQGTPAQIKTAFAQLDSYYNNLLSTSDFNITNQGTFQLFPNPTKDSINIILDSFKTDSKIRIYNTLGSLVYSSKEIVKEISIPTAKIGTKGTYLIKIDGITKKLIIE